MQVKYPGPERLVFNEALKRMLNALVDDLIAETGRNVKRSGATTLEAVRHAPARLVTFSPEMEELRLQAKRYLYANLYNAPELQRDHQEAELVIRTLFRAWVADPALLPPAHLTEIAVEGVPRVVADYIAGMTDQYILAQYQAWVKTIR
jgi:dGTPase